MIIEDYKLSSIKKFKITFVIGTFDLFHYGHLFFLKKAKEIAPKNKLLVCVLSDKNVKNNKDKKRPIINEKDRAEIVNAINIVDYVFINKDNKTSDTIKKVLSEVSPKLCVVTKNSWKENNKKLGANIVFIDKMAKNISTTNIINKIKRLYK